MLPFVEVIFKNLKTGYYFLYQDKLYLKINDFSASQLFSRLDKKYFTDRSSHFTSVDEKLDYKRPSGIMVRFEPDDVVNFVKYDDIRKHILEEHQNIEFDAKFKDIPIGSPFYIKNKDMYYMKTSFYKAKPFYSIKVGLTDLQSISLSTVSSALQVNKEYNSFFYNGQKIFDFNLDAFNVVWFNKTYSNYTFDSFDTEKNYYLESNRLLNFIDDIPNDSLVFVINSNNTQITADIKNKDDIPRHISRIFKDYEKAQNIFESVGIEKTMIDNIGRMDAFIVLSKKNNKRIKLETIKQPVVPNLSLLDEVVDQDIIEIVYDIPLNDKFYQYGESIVFDLNDNVKKTTMTEVYARVMYNLKSDDPRLLSDTDLYDFT